MNEFFCVNQNNQLHTQTHHHGFYTLNASLPETPVILL